MDQRALIEGTAPSPTLTAAEPPPVPEVHPPASTTATPVTDPDRSVHQLFEEQVARTPDAPALRFEDEVTRPIELTYRGLDARANQLAHYLIGLGVETETPVGICTERCPEMVIAMLGILKAGGAYVPLDPEYPDERLSFIASDARLQIVLSKTGSSKVDRLPGLRVVSLSGNEDLLRHDTRPPSPRGDGGSLIYVIYTSGSTGRPKGVMVEHRGVVNRLAWGQKEYRLTPDDRVLQKTPYSFDVSVWELFWPLLTGAQLVIAKPGGHRDPEYLARTIQRQKVTIAHFVPSMLRTFLRCGSAGRCVGLRHVMCSGEELTADVVAAFRRTLPTVRIHNLYGPTEASIEVSSWECRDEDALPAAKVPIGRPIDNISLHVLDRDGRPQPTGVAGELHIGGVGLARGYLNRPKLTAEAFIADPSCGGAANRLYRTGDLARWRSDGVLEFLGRTDHQVKIRGFRVEIGEIESVLSSHPGVAEVAVIARDDASGVKRLDAYWVPDDGRSAGSGELRAFLLEKLPEHMVPSVFRAIERLPLTASGKIDRQALLRMEIEPEGVSATPQTPVELDLVAIWCELLRLGRVGRDDSFLELGGHSLLAIELATRVRDRFGVDIPVGELLGDPVLAGMAARIEAGIEAGRDRGRRPEPVWPTIRPSLQDRFEPFPLTDVQQAYWIGRNDELELGGVATHSYEELRVKGLDVDRYERAWRRVIERHEMLRAVVLADGRQQVLESVPPFAIERVDLRDHSPDEIGCFLEDLRERMSHRVLPADRWPLFEICAVRLSEEWTDLHLSFDVLNLDAWSMEVLRREVDRSYADPNLVLPPLELSFRDYVLAERSLRGSELYRGSLAYWRDRLPTLPPAPELPLAKSPTAVGKPRFRRLSGSLAAERWRALKARAAAVGVTPSVALFTAFSEILALWSRTAHFTINVTLFNRLPLHREVKDVVGAFISMVLLEADLRGRSSFEDRARGLQAQLWKDMDHRYVGGVQVLRELMQQRGGTPRAMMPVVFTSMLIHGDGERAKNGPDAPRISDSFESLYSVSQTPQVWLDHQVEERGGALHYCWDVVEELFPPGLLADMFNAYGELVESLAGGTRGAAWTEVRARPPLPPSQLKMLSQLRQEDAEVSPELLHAGFAKQAAARPEAAAILTEDETLTYGELFGYSNQVGRWLRGRGVERNTLVAIVMEKGWEQVVASLGILASGAAYLPIDAGLPKRRLRYLLEHGEAVCVLTQPWLEQRLEWPEGLPVLALPRHGLDGVSPEPLTPRQSATDLAYVIFTSGSTGDPKGVMIDHRGAVNTILDVNERFAVTPEDSVLALSALNFDLSVYDIFGMLAAGGAIVLPRADGTRDPQHWSRLMKRHRVTLWNTVPALMEMLVEHSEGRAERLPADLRLVFMSGDWIPLTLPERIRALGRQGIELHSGGGATEASIWSITYPIGEVLPHWRSIPYGKPMRNQSFRILDDDLDDRPIWAPGHLHIGGIGLAKGYWKDQEKTARSFFTHPATGERLYRTGDLGCYLPDGNIEFLGREDTQVKIRGHRIELGEIESALVQHPSLESCVVSALGDPRGSKSLVAYVVTRDGEELTAAEMRSYLEERLPSYMVPTDMVQLELLPLTPNGKVDRKALPAPPRRGTPSADERRERPTTPLEKRMISIWAEVLGIEGIGPDDEFFELGGDSLMATRVVSRIRSALAVDVSIRALFESPTVRGLCAVVEARSARREELQGPPILPAERGPRPPLSFGQERLWFLDRLEPGSAAFNSAFAYEIEGSLDVDLLGWSLGEVVRRHEVLRTTFRTDDGGTFLHVAPSWGRRLEVIDLRPLDADERERRVDELAAAESTEPFDLVAGPLLRATLLCLAEDSYLLLLTAHHVAFDGWSLGIFLKDLIAAYRGGLEGRRTPLAELPLQYHDYGVWQRRWVAEEVVEAQMEHWHEALAGAPSALDMPLDFPRPPVQTSRGSSVRLDVAGELFDRLGELGREAGATDFIVLLAAFNVLLSRYTHQQDIVIGTPIANRTRTEVEELIGLFVNPLALRTDLSGDPTFRELLRRVRERLLAAYAHQDLPFEKLVEELQPERDLSRTPIFQAMFIMQNEPAYPFELPGVSIRERELEVFTCQFDLVLDVRAVGGGLEGRIEYNSDLFRRDSIERLAASFGTLLEDACESPGKRLSELRVLTEEDAHTLLRSWNDTAVDYPRDSCFDEIFVQQVARAPEATAAVCGGERLTYAELDRRAGRIAGHLAATGIGPDSIVVLLAERGLDLLAAILGVFRAGAAYLPFDPRHPVARYSQLLAESGATIVLTTRPFERPMEEAIAALEAGPEPTLLSLERLLAEDPPETAAASVEPTDLAYVIYTSGSTGRPKGAMVEHRGMLNHLYAKVRALGLSDQSRVAQTASQCFDISVWQLLAPLLVVGQTHIYPDDVAHDFPRLLQEVDRDAISALESVPSMMQVMLDELTARPPERRPRLSSLRFMVPTGEALPPELCRRWLGAYPEVPLLNAYGPTECSDDVTHHPIHQAPDEGTVNMPIGVPIQNTQIYILNDDLQPVPIGAAGELFVGGDGVGRGYLGRPDLTAQQFIPDPFRDDGGGRLYRTGDYARHLPSGLIEYLGRRDQQVKLRGFRIELGEIESVLRDHAEVGEAVVAARNRAADLGNEAGALSSSGDLWLVAYVVCRGAAALAKDEIRAYLKGRLPEHMVPSCFVQLEAMPLTRNGKVDRRALPAPDVAESGAARAAPGGCFFTPRWRPSPPQAARRSTTDRSWLVLGDRGALTGALVEILRGRGQTVVQVREGKRLGHRKGVFTIRPQSGDDHLALIDRLRDRDQMPGAILHLWNVEPLGTKALQDPVAATRYSAGSLGCLAAALAGCTGVRPIDLSVVSTGLQRVGDGDLLQPEKAPLLGLGRVMQQEIEGLLFRSIDIEAPIADPASAERAARQILGEIESGAENPVVAYRRGRRYVQAFENRVVEAPQADDDAEEAAPVYLIVDEPGGSGASVGVDLARTLGARIVLVGPVPLPEPAARPEYLASHPEDDPGARLIRAVQQLEALGRPGLTIRAEPASASQMRAAVQATLRRFGAIEGVVYATAHGPGTPVAADRPESLSRSLGASIRGAKAVGEAISGAEVGRLWLCAPLAALIGGRGRSVPCAGGAYLRAFAESRSAAGDPPTTAVFIDFEGLSRATAGHPSKPGRSFREEALSRLGACGGVPSIAITAESLPTLLEESRRFGSSTGPVDTVSDTQSTTEAAIASMWQELLGVQRVCRTDSFFRVGGHSLAALQLVSRLREEFKVDLPVRASFEAPTIEELARRVDQARGEEAVPITPLQPGASPAPDAGRREVGAARNGDGWWARLKGAFRTAPQRPAKNLDTNGAPDAATDTESS